jgi:hypothetical protein
MNKILLFICSLCFIFQASLAQNAEKNLVQENLIPSLSSDRFLANSKVKKNGMPIPAESLKEKSNWDQKQFSIEVKNDSIRWVVTDQQGESFQISYPNEYSLFFGRDKKILQEELIEKIKSSTQSSLMADSANNSPIDSVITKTIETKYGILKNQFFENQLGQRIFSDQLIPESFVNSLMFPNESTFLTALSLNFHKYGNQSEELNVDFNSLRAGLPQYESWSIWSVIQRDYLLVLFEHPFLNFHHMLILKDIVRGNELKGDFYSFIPNSNFEELFASYKSNKELIEININNEENYLD